MIDSEELKWVLHKHGWLKVGQLAVLLRGNSAPADIRAIQRLIQTNEKALSTVKGPDGKRLIALKENRGALKKLGQYAHKNLCTDICISLDKPGTGWEGRIWTEQDIQKGLLFKGPVLGKVPDIAIMYDEDKIIWVEVENSKRNAKSMSELVDWIIKITREPEQGMYPELSQGWLLERIRFYCTDQFAAKLYRELWARAHEYCKGYGESDVETEDLATQKTKDFWQSNIEYFSEYEINGEIIQMS